MTRALPPDEAFDALTNPKSVVIVGASANPNGMAGAPLHNLREQGFTGEIFIVNPGRREVAGIPSLPSVRDLPHEVDTAIVVVPAGSLPGLLPDLRQVTSTATVVAAGFGGAAGITRPEMRRLILQSGLRVLGPNTAGVINVNVGYCPRAARNHPGVLEGGSVALVSQSGGAGNLVFNRAQAAGLGVGLLIGTGDSLDLTIWDAARYAAARPEIDTVMLLAEGALPPGELQSLSAVAAQSGVSLVLLKHARSTVGRTAALSHTGSIVGPSDVELAAARALGYAVVSEFDELWQVAWLLRDWGPAPATPIRLGIFSTSGGVAVAAADLADEMGFELPSPSAETAVALAALDREQESANPFDAGGGVLAAPGKLATAVRAFANDPAFDFVLVAMAVMQPTIAEPITRGMVDGLGGLTRPVALSLFHAGPGTEFGAGRIRQLRRPTFDGTRGGLAAVAAWREATRRIGRTTLVLATGPAVPSVTGPRSYWESRLVLEGLGLPVPAARLARTEQDAARAHADLGGQIVMKASSRGAAHKFAAGLVSLDVSSPEAARREFGRLSAAASAIDGYDGIVCEVRAAEGLDLFVGGRQDPRYGPVMTVGTGGWLAEVVGDKALLLPPFDEPAVTQALGETVIGRVISRGSGRLAHGIVRFVTRLGGALMRGEFAEVDVNPLRCDLATGTCLALDALVVSPVGPAADPRAE